LKKARYLSIEEKLAPLLARCPRRLADVLAVEPSPGAIAALRAAETIGRPLGAPAFLDRFAALTGRDPRPVRANAARSREREGRTRRMIRDLSRCRRNS
jgi:putative transposase